MNDFPLVSVICLCYNHEKYVEQAIQSVFDQSYDNIELIVVDDASTDSSGLLIEKILENSSAEFIKNDTNLGNNKAFNLGFSKSTGKYIIDLAADDILVKDRIEKQVSFFEGCNNNVGVIYSDAIYIGESGEILKTHFDKSNFEPYCGEIYEKLISNYFIPPPSMMIKREVLMELNGYDENLAYEDFDFWIRSSRNWHYQYQSEILTKIRKTSGSLSSRLYSKNDKQLYSTYLVCEKIKLLNEKQAETDALTSRLKYEIKHAVLSGNFIEAKLFLNLYKELCELPLILRFLSLLNKWEIDLSLIRRVYLKMANKRYHLLLSSSVSMLI